MAAVIGRDGKSTIEHLSAPDPNELQGPFKANMPHEYFKDQTGKVVKPIAFIPNELVSSRDTRRSYIPNGGVVLQLEPHSPISRKTGASFLPKRTNSKRPVAESEVSSRTSKNET